jgi:restriction endonuclease S subunit
MAVWSAIPISHLEYSRIDADFYQPTYLKELKYWRQLDKNVGAAKLGQLIATPVRTGRTPKARRIKGDEPCVRFIKTDTVREGSIDFDNSPLLPRRVISDRDYIQKDALVITIIGATPEIVGRTAIVRPVDPECVTNQNVAVVRTSENCDPYYLTAYFQTKWGRDQIWRHSRRTEQVNLNCREVERVLVPNPAASLQKSIGNLVRNSFASSDQSLALYRKAEQLLESELRLDKLIFQKPVGFIAQFSELETANRSDAQHYQARFRDLIEHISTFHSVRIRDIRSYNRRGLQPVYVKDGQVDVVNSQHLGTRHVDYDGLEKTSAPAFAAVPEAHIQKDDLLIYTTGAYIGRTNVYLSDVPAMASNHVNILRLRPGIDTAYMALVFQSAVGQFQTQKHARGSAQAELYPTDIDRFVVPLLDTNKQEEMGNLVRESLALHSKSRNLLEQAKARVEELIMEAVEL